MQSESSQSHESVDERDDERDELLSTSGIESEEDEGGDCNDKIPKPIGEAGRPRSGGYNLKEMLGWPKADFDKIQVRGSLAGSDES